MTALKFIWGALWRTTLFLAVVSVGLWYFNRAPDWSGQDLIDRGDTAVEGKAGVIVVALIQPGEYDPRFYINFVEKIFTQVIPWPINVLAGADAGTVLVDPDQIMSTEPYQPARLVDLNGSETDIDGTPWIAKLERGEVRWAKPSPTVPDDFGHYLFPERKQGMRTAAAKLVAKVKYVYYDRLPNGYLPHDDQTVAMVEGALDQVRERKDVVAAELIDAFDPHAKQKAVNKVLDAGADTIVLGSAQPFYSDFEELDGSFVGIHQAVEKWRKKNGGKPIKIVIPPYLGSTAEFDDFILRHFEISVPEAQSSGQRAMGIFTLHGLPPSLVDSDSWSARVKSAEKRLLPRMEKILQGKGYTASSVHFASEGFADDIEDPENVIVSVSELFERASEENYDIAIAIPLEFLAENTDMLFAHSALMFDGLPGYSLFMGPPEGTDWSAPYVREFQLGKTRLIYAGAAGGDAVPEQSAALASAIGSVLD